MSVAIIYRDELREYDFGSGHPFHGGRYGSFMQLLSKRLPAGEHYTVVAGEQATDADLLKICDEDYIRFSRDYFQAVHGGWVSYYENYSRYHSPDNKPIGTPGKLEEAARLIVGQAKLACDLVQSGQYTKAISVGGGMHHAKQRFGEGFCIYNDVAFAALYLLEKYALQRIMVLDTDAHAGNGTSEYLRGNTRILYVDVHQDPRTIYPGTGFTADVGADKARGLTVNIPMPIRAGNASYLMAFDRVILPLAREFKPQVIIRNGGSDPHFNDGLTNLGMTVSGFRVMGDRVREMAEVCQGKLIDLIASGYNEHVLPYAWLSLESGIADFPITVEEPEQVPTHYEQDLVLGETEKVLDEVRKYHQPYWQCFK